MLCGETGCGEGSELLVLADGGVEPGDACSERGVLNLEPGDLVLARVVRGESADSLLECGLQVWVAAVERRPGDPGLAGEGGDVEFPARGGMSPRRSASAAARIRCSILLRCSSLTRMRVGLPVRLGGRAAGSCIAAAASIAVNTRGARSSCSELSSPSRLPG